MHVHRSAGVFAAAVVIGGLLAGCGSNTNTGPRTLPPAATSTPATGQQPHKQADAVFRQNMIPHHLQAIMMSQLARNQATSPQVKALAARIEAEQGLEIQQMRDLLAGWGVPVPATLGGGGPMGGMWRGQMPGMMNGPAFDGCFSR